MGKKRGRPPKEETKEALIAKCKTAIGELATLNRSTSKQWLILGELHDRLSFRYFMGSLKETAKETGAVYSSVKEWVHYYEDNKNKSEDKLPQTQKAARADRRGNKPKPKPKPKPKIEAPPSEATEDVKHPSPPPKEEAAIVAQIKKEMPIVGKFYQTEGDNRGVWQCEVNRTGTPDAPRYTSRYPKDVVTQTIFDSSISKEVPRPAKWPWREKEQEPKAETKQEPKDITCLKSKEWQEPKEQEVNLVSAKMVARILLNTHCKGNLDNAISILTEVAKETNAVQN